jgi:Photosynthetic reaction centre cytochrome C subunit
LIGLAGEITLMHHRTIIFIALSVTLAITIHGVRLTTEAAAQQADKPVEEVQKNIQVLKGLPSSQLLPVMHFMRTSLGVRCDYCHVAQNDKYWMDDKPAKQTARRMLQMVFDINKANFGGQPVVTCNTCHRGSTKPVPVPAIGQGAFANTTRDEEERKTTEQLPLAEQVFDRYVQALGGKTAIEKIKTRMTKVMLLRPKLVNAGTPKAAILNRGETLTMETYQKAPGKYLAVITTADGVVYQGFNGTDGWTKTARGQRQMNTAELARIKQQADLYKEIRLADLYKEIRLKEQYSKVEVIGKEKIGERKVYVLEGRWVAGKTERFYFEVKSGLLLRRTVFTAIKLGRDPEQTDYEDYREVDGVWLPFTIRTSYLDDNHFGTTRTLLTVKQNIQIDDSKFEMPTAP